MLYNTRTEGMVFVSLKWHHFLSNVEKATTGVSTIAVFLLEYNWERDGEGQRGLGTCQQSDRKTELRVFAYLERQIKIKRQLVNMVNAGKYKCQRGQWR